MPTTDLKPLRDRLAAAIASDKACGKYRDALLRAAEGYVVFDTPPEDRPDQIPGLGDMPYDQATALYAAAKADRDRRALDRLPVGASRFGGVPDLPPDIAWPEADGRKLQFLAQIDFARLPRWEGTPLPPDGWLYHFGLYVNDHDWVTVLRHYRGPQERLVRAHTPAVEEIWPTDDGDPVYDLVPLVPRLGLSVDGYRVGKAVGEDPWRFADGLAGLLEREDVREPQPKGHEVAGWVLGEFAGMEGKTAAQHAEEFDLDGDDWINLLAITSSGSMEWGDGGHLYLLIRRSDLARVDFSRVEMVPGTS